MLTVRDPRDPLLEVAEQKPPELARPDAYHALLRSMRQYADRRILGRSFLIGGARGSGKTTLVRLAIHELQREHLEGKLKTRPILVPLHGPDLLGGAAMLRPQAGVKESKKAEKEDQAAEDGVKKAAGTPDKPAATNGEPVEPESTAAAMVMLARSLHRAVVDELSSCFAVEARARLKTDAAELAAQLRYELDHAAETAVLREFWARVGALESGVLFARNTALPEGRSEQGQGIRELAAASNVAEAFRLVAGKLQQTDTADSSSKAAGAVTWGGQWAAKDLFNGAVALLAGGTAAAAAMSQAKGFLLPAAAGAAVAVLSNFTLGLTGSRSRDRGTKSKRVFTWDTSLASLDRLLPAVVERVMEAGISPIFVVDELDKVDNVGEQMGKLVNHLKHFVTERAFFCFLADRRYYEEVSSRTRTRDYAAAYTFFSSHLFVSYQPKQIRDHIAQLVVLESEIPDVDPIARQAQSVRLSDEALDAQVLPYFIAAKARLHPIDVVRTIRELTDSGGRLTLLPGEVRSRPSCRLAILMQLAVEEVMWDEEVASRSADDRDFHRLLLDGLYYPAWTLERGNPTVDVREDSFARYLARRRQSPEPTKAAGAGGDQAEAAPVLELTSDERFAHSSMLQVLQFLALPDALRQALIDRLVRSDQAGEMTTLVDMLPSPDLGDEQAIVRLVGNEWVWTVDRHGVQLPLMSSASPSSQDVRQKAARLEMVAAQLSAIDGSITLDRLANPLGILAAAPVWSYVARAAHSIRNRPETLADTLKNERQTVEDYYRMLAARAHIVCAALFSAVLLGDRSQPFEPLAAISRFLDLRKADLAVTRDRVLGLLGSILEGFTEENLPIKAEETKESVSKILEMALNFESDWLAELIELAPSLLDLHPIHRKAADTIRAEAEGDWLRFIEERAKPGASSRKDPSPADIWLGARDMASITAQIEEMTVVDWAEALPRIVDRGLLRACLTQLGFTVDGQRADPAQTSRERVLIVIDRNHPPPDGWRPSKQHAVLPVFWDRLQSAFDLLGVVGMPSLMLIIAGPEFTAHVALPIIGTAKIPAARVITDGVSPEHPWEVAAVTLDDAIAGVQKIAASTDPLVFWNALAGPKTA